MPSHVPFTLASGAFLQGGEIPAVHTCDGPDQSPPLQWSEPPAGTRSFALIADDPDAPMGTWVHWVLYDLPAVTRALSLDVPKDPELPSGARQGRNDFGRIGYGGPCPPKGPAHRYVFRLRALEITLSLPAGARRKEVESAMQGHVLATAELMGTYGRPAA
ncbi:MAG TPA: YbhB/YbcL family Raf kinase inhibitor-like protein [Candidatus Polarisedimenticolia bacterium]|nr:YbhB/YbcL family Raf kinase inhibitor-like protein [Candidatus Polarisedimenticolia bacterium]